MKFPPSAQLSDTGPQTKVAPEPLTLVLLGHTGVGKSASGNTILHRDAFESRQTFSSVTTEISEQWGSVGGQEVRVVDTPGILTAQQEIRAYCQELMKNNKHYVFLFIVKTKRFTKEEEKALRTAISVVGEEGQSRGLLLFTEGDLLGDMTLNQFINKDPESPLVKLVEEFGDRFHVFNNTQRGKVYNQGQVQELIEKICHIPPVTTMNPLNPRRLEDVRLVLFGLPGAGKSSSGNTILGSEVFEAGCDFDSLTTETIPNSAEVDGRKVTVVDTPGFNPKCLPLDKYFRHILLSVIDADPGPNAFVIVVRLGRISEADLLFFQMMSLLFDRDLKYFTVLFTHGDGLKGKSIKDQIEANPTVRELVSKCGGRYSVFNNNQSGNLSQVQNLLRVIDQIHSENDGQHYTLEMLFKHHNLLLENPISSASLNDLDSYPTDVTSQDLIFTNPAQGPTDPTPADIPSAQGPTDPTPAGEQPIRSLWERVKAFLRWFGNKIKSFF